MSSPDPLTRSLHLHTCEMECTPVDNTDERGPIQQLRGRGGPGPALEP